VGTPKKSPDAFRTISEVADLLDIPAHVLRFWESRFTQIKPVKRGGGRRYYRPQDINLLRGIQDMLYSEGLTIKGAQKVLREQGVKQVAAMGEMSAQQAADAPVAPVEVPAAAPTPAPPRPEPVSEPLAVRTPEPVAAMASSAPEPSPEQAMPKPAIPEPTTAQKVPEDPARAEALPNGWRSDVTIAKPPVEGADMQYDLFARDSKQARPPFPPDPAQAKRKDDLRQMITKLEALRKKMASRV